MSASQPSIHTCNGTCTFQNALAADVPAMDTIAKDSRLDISSSTTACRETCLRNWPQSSTRTEPLQDLAIHCNHTRRNRILHPDGEESNRYVRPIYPTVHIGYKHKYS